ncbi:diacylglycerol kinase epsilon isoform X2 [Diachasmimorpha longicaudata]|uniref:diacylglycerol kinase epsilon isoform X2 n=1 Tax=Diachasmimorpha longicaudata TaxID=58733 RepID=UPI0030B8D12C
MESCSTWVPLLCAIVVTLGILLLIYGIVMSLLKYIMKDSSIPAGDIVSNHNWMNFSCTSIQTYYCNICELLLIPAGAIVCDSCGIYVDARCIKLAEKKFKCKATTLPNDQPMLHHWIKGNLPARAICEFCHTKCGTASALIHWSCCWCQCYAHDECKNKNDMHICLFGKFQSMIIPPYSLDVSDKPKAGQKHLELRSIIPPAWPDWTPLIVVANRKAGNNDGAEILSLFRRLLNPIQVFDLSNRDPVAALEWCQLLEDKPCNFLVAGGDGTVAWLLNAIHKLKLKATPSVAILPLGTGNDLSRVLGWGKEPNPKFELTDILQRIQTAHSVKLDRWAVSMNSESPGLGFRGEQQGMFMYNYLSVGVDAQIALNFHRMRESKFYICSHRIFNKLLYLGFGTQQVIGRRCKHLDKRIEVYLDGEQINLPSIESIVILNIPSWGAGVKLWELGLEGNAKFSEQSINDGMLEVCAIYSSFHIAQLQMGVSKPHRLGQAHTVKIKLIESYAVQIDGEPWLQGPCEFTITHCDQASMLTSNEKL